MSLHSPGKRGGAILDGNPCKQREPQSESARLRVLYPFPRQSRLLAVPAVPSCQTNVYRGFMLVRGRTGGRTARVSVFPRLRVLYPFPPAWVKMTVTRSQPHKHWGFLWF